MSTDIVQWIQLAPVIQVRPTKWDNLHVWAPSIVEQSGVYFLYYTGVTHVPFGYNWYQRIGVATSTELLNWQRYDEPVYDAAHSSWALSDSSRELGCVFRDPFVMPDPGVPGAWLMYHVATPTAALPQRIVGHARNLGGFTPWLDSAPM